MARRAAARPSPGPAPKRVTIGRLRDQLSAHLALVRDGAQVIVLDRTVPVARLIPYEADEAVRGLDDLVARGVVTVPTEACDWEAFDRLPSPRLRGNPLLDALVANRDED